jgi:hypothetical protein
MSSLTLYPSNWLYNAGVIGLLRVLESAGDAVANLFRDGTIIGDEIRSRLKSILHGEKSGLPESPLDKLPKWHWHYAKTSFEWNYGSITDFVIDRVRKAEHSTNKSALKEQIQLIKKSKSGKKESIKLTYENQAIDFGDINNAIADIWSKTFVRNPQYTLDKAAAEIIKSIRAKENFYIYRKAIGYLFSQGGFYQNLYNPGWFGDLKKFIDFFASDKVFRSASSSASVCSFCSESKFEVEPVDATQMSFLFPVFSKFPNAYWQNDEKAVTQICSLCKFVIIHHHLALTRLSDGSEIFINAPSFQVMWYLNQFARKVLGSASSEEMQTKRTLLAMSVIEYATRIRATLGVWTGMNIEVVSKRGDQIEFFSLPYEVIQLLSDRRIASLLSQIGEFEILNRVLNHDFSRLMEMGYRLLRIGLKPYSERAKSENEFVYRELYLEKNRRNPAGVAEQIFKLCALIEEKRKRREEYDHIRFART